MATRHWVDDTNPWNIQARTVAREKRERMRVLRAEEIEVKEARAEAEFRPIETLWSDKGKTLGQMPGHVQWFVLLRRAEWFRRKTGLRMGGFKVGVQLGSYVQARSELAREVALWNLEHPGDKRFHVLEQRMEEVK